MNKMDKKVTIEIIINTLEQFKINLEYISCAIKNGQVSFKFKISNKVNAIKILNYVDDIQMRLACREKVIIKIIDEQTVGVILPEKFGKEDCVKSSNGLHVRLATEKDIQFIKTVYDENIQAIHGEQRDLSKWRELVYDEQSKYYIVANERPVAWFRIDFDTSVLWAGMIIVAKNFQCQGVGKYIFQQLEQLAVKNGYSKIGVHTTEDNIVAKTLYEKLDFEIMEYDDCMTADGSKMKGYTFIKALN